MTKPKVTKTPAKEVPKVETDLTKNALCKVDPNNKMAYIDIPFIPKPIGGEYDDEDEMHIRIPKMKLLGTNSPELKKATRVEGAEEGMFFNTLTRELWESLEVVPLFKFTERYYNKPAGSNNMVCTSRDGLGKIGICLSGRYNEEQIVAGWIKEDGVDIQVGICKRCQWSKRAYGETAACQKVIHLVCVHREFLQKSDELMQLLETMDPTIASKILSSMFTLPFKNTTESMLEIILQTAYVSGCYFNQSWFFESREAESEKFNWQTYVIQSGTALTDTEKILAHSIKIFAQKLRKIIRITDIEESPFKPVPPGSPTEVDIT